MGDLLQPWHLIVILVVALLIFGPSKLPGLGKGLGEGIKGFKEGIKGIGSSDDEKTDTTVKSTATEIKTPGTK